MLQSALCTVGVKDRLRLLNFCGSDPVASHPAHRRLEPKRAIYIDSFKLSCIKSAKPLPLQASRHRRTALNLSHALAFCPS